MKEKFKKKVLKNGLTILFEKRDLPIVSLGFAVRSGAAHEKSEEKGISHFIEHMLFKGTKTRDCKKLSEAIENLGGVMNGATDEFLTMYYCKIPSEHLNVALDVYIDMIKNSVFDEKELEKERKVIFEEIKRRKDYPTHYVLSEIKKYLYEAPFGEPILGSFYTLNSFNREKILSYFQEKYAPNKLILCVVGNADFDLLVRDLEKKFRNEKVPDSPFEINKINKTKIEKREGLDQANLALAYHVPTASDKSHYAAYVLHSLMASGASSILFQEIREKRNLAYVVAGGSEITLRHGYNFVYVGTAKENVDEVKKIILEEFEKVAESLTDEELEIVKTKMIGNYRISMEDSGEQMEHLIKHEIDGLVEEVYEFEKNIQNVKLGDVKNLAKSVGRNYSFFALVPED